MADKDFPEVVAQAKPFGITALRESCDTLIVIPNDRLLQLGDSAVSLMDAFRSADEVLEMVNDLLDLLRSGGGRILSVVPLKRTLEEIFVETVGVAGTSGRRIGTMNQLSKDGGS